MNKVMSGYFDDAHRGLMRQQQAGGGGGTSASSSTVQLPPLRTEGSSQKLAGISGAAEAEGYPRGGDKISFLQPSNSMGSLDFSQDQISRGVQQERYQQSLQDNSKLSRKIRSLQEQLAITSAKKDAFRAQAQRLEKEFRKGRDQSDALQRELLEAKQHLGVLTKENAEAAQIVAEMRKSHIHEVRLLQRGLAAAKGDDRRNKVNETADLVDKLGRAVVQRDEAIRDKTKLEAQFRKASTDLQAVTGDCGGLRKQNRDLQARLKEALRKAQYRPPKTEDVPPEDSDEEFEAELSSFERRFQILEEGPAGLDILASNLSRDKRELEKRVKELQDMIKKLNGDCDTWKATCAEKDLQVQELSSQMEKAVRNQALLEEQMKQKRREIELQVQEERAALESRIRQLEQEADSAREAADGMEKASTRLTQELVKVHEQYSRPVAPDEDAEAEAAILRQPAEAEAAPVAAPEDSAGAQAAVTPAPEPPGEAAAAPQLAEPPGEAAAAPALAEAEPLASETPASPPGEAAAAPQLAEPPGEAAAAPALAEAEPLASETPASAEPQAAEPVAAEPQAAEPAPPTPGALATAEQAAKTGEALRLEVFEAGDGFELSARELPDGPEARLPVSAELLLELDAQDRWNDLFSRVGVSLGPPRTIVISQLAARGVVELPPDSGIEVRLEAFRYDDRRYFIRGVELSTGKPCSVALLEDRLTSDVADSVAACPDEGTALEVLSQLLSFEAETASLTTV